MTNFVSYLRVSTQRQGATGLGIEAQRTAVDQYMGSIGGTLLEEHVEVESGANRQRPVLLKSIAQAKKLGAVLVIAKLDRLARNVAFVSALMEAGVEFVAVDFPAANKLLIHIMAAVAEHERMLVSERTKAALAAAKARGVKLGSNGHRLAATNRSNAKIFAEQMREPLQTALAAGAGTLQALANQLNELGYRTRENCLWSAQTVQRVMGRLDMRVNLANSI